MDVVVFQCARFSGISRTSESEPVRVCGTVSSCVGERSAAVEKSRSRRLRKSFMVLGADGVGAA